MSWLHAIGNWIYYFFGFSGTGSHYAAWSGALSDVGELTILGAVVAIYHRHNCGVRWCPWIGIHPVDGTHHKTCHIHSTLAKHHELREAHKRDFPDQHELMGLKK